MSLRSSLFHPSNRQNDIIWAINTSLVPVTETVKQQTKMMVWGMMNFQSLRPLHRVTQQNCYSGLLRGGSADGGSGIDDEATDGERVSNSGQASVQMLQAIYQQDKAQFTPPPRHSGGARPTSLPFGRSTMAEKQHRPVAHRKFLGDRSGQGRQDGPGAVRGKTSVRPGAAFRHRRWTT